MAKADGDKASKSNGPRAAEAQDAVSLVDELLARARESGASDVHFEPTQNDLVVKFRLDGVLTVFESLPKSLGERTVTRLKVLAGLLTYRNDIPQEGRMAEPVSQGENLRLTRRAVG